MPLINIVITLVIVGVALWAINKFIPMPRSIKTVLNLVVVVVLCLWLLNAFGVIDNMHGIRLQ